MHTRLPNRPMVGIQISVTDKVKSVLQRQAGARGYALSVWCGMLFDQAYAAVCAREKGLIHTDADLDAVVAGCLLLWARDEWDTAEIGQRLGISEATVAKILDVWRDYRRGQS